MLTHTFYLPTMYADHHTLAVRRILLDMPGVLDVYASSCFQIVDVSYDPAQTEVEALRTALAEAGYGETLAVPTERTSAAHDADRRSSVRRHSAAYAQTGRVISFAQPTSPPEPTLWPCPGLGAIRVDK
ncbi:MAG: heavy-metal-associated domain-containing protein [Anaerolineae bacterium]|nr:heavy-metal-associated domain-containing protein [Anaerolineae bacterium]